MYTYPRIISTPISNNRLNWNERENHTIVVPSLIEWTLDDVQIGEETVIESEVNGKMMSGKWLKNFVFLKNSRVPTWIMDNHNHASAFWHEAFWKWWIQKWSLLIHIDQHTDLATPVALPEKKEKWKNSPPLFSFSSSFLSLQEVEDYTNSVLTIADFIVPALATGLISEAVMVTGEDMQTSRCYVWEEKNEKIKNKKDWFFLNNSTLWPLSFDLFPSIIVDIDLDYFSQGFDEAKTLETTKYWIEKADIITIATSPLFIDQEKALSMLKSLQSSLVLL